MIPAIGRYRIDRQLGEGGMGVVYAAYDERLDRPVALKMLRTDRNDPRGRERLRREARAAASISHPHICQIYDVDEADHEVFVTMELLEGEPLSARLARGALPLADACALALAMLAALDALHRRGFVHRDLKPSNVFLTPHGVKLLDFGLAVPSALAAGAASTRLTLPGTLLGTPHYIAPEQIRGEPVDARSDIFAMGVVLAEMLTGLPPFDAPTAIDVMHHVLHDVGPTLAGAAIPAAPIVARAIAKRPEYRFESARAMADALRLLALGLTPSATAPPPPSARVTARLIVLPFRLLRPDADVDFLGLGLADAITGSLMGLGSLIVRSSLTAMRFDPASLDLAALARQADVDVALTGTVLRHGANVRITAQLVEVPSGTVLWSDSSTGSLDDVFRLQDELAQRIVASLELPLTAREHRLLRRDVPASPRAYERYLRGVQLGALSSTWPAARDLLEQCVTEDPQYAPAWARLGRLYRLLAKYSDEHDASEIRRAEGALRRALEINPDLTLAHTNVAAIDVEMGRATQAMARLLSLAHVTPSDATLYLGLVHACRYGGLLDASLAAQHRARVLDPGLSTSAANTYFMLGQYRRGLEDSDQPLDSLRSLFLAILGRTDEASAASDEERETSHGTLRQFTLLVRAAIDDDRMACRRALDAIRRSGFRDPEGFFYMSLAPARLGEVDEALEFLRRAVQGGFACPVPLRYNPWLEPVRARPEFGALLEDADARHREAVDAFAAADGPTVLGVPARTQEI